jgi:hypothetical protein
LRRLLMPICPDAYSPLMRDFLTRSFAKRRELARRWMFKNRVEKRRSREAALMRSLGIHNISQLLIRQAD